MFYVQFFYLKCWTSLYQKKTKKLQIPNIKQYLFLFAMSATNHRFTGNLFLDNGTGTIYASGGGLLSNSVAFDSLNRGNAGYVALYKEVDPGAGTLTGGIPKSMTPSPGALVQWDASGDIAGVQLIGGNITATTINATTVNSDSVVILVAPTLPSQAATVQYVNDAISSVVGGFNWLAPVINFETVPPVGPANGDRYVALATVGPWIKNNIYEWNAGTVSWDVTVAVDGMALTSVQGDPITPIGGPASYLFTAGSGWLLIGFNGMHDNLVGKKNTNSVSSDTVQVNGGTVNGVVYSWPTMLNRVCTGVIELVGASNSANGRAHFTWHIDVQNHLGVATFSVSSSTVSTAGDLAGSTASLAVEAVPNQEFLDIRVTPPGIISAYWHVTIEATCVPIVVP